MITASFEEGKGWAKDSLFKNYRKNQKFGKFRHFLKQHNFRADRISNKKRLSEEQRLSRPTQIGLQGTQRTDASGAAFAVDIVDETHE